MSDVKLVVVRGRPLGAEIALRAGRFLIGRDRSCHLRPRGAGVGGRQCALERRGPHLVVRDLAGGGTLVNGRGLDAGDVATLGHGDELGVGPLTFAVKVEAGPEPAPAEVDPMQWLTPDAADPAAAAGLRAAYRAASPSAGPPPEAAAAPAPVFAYREFDRRRGVLCVGFGPFHFLGDAEARATRRALLDLVERRGHARLVVDLSAIDWLPSLAVAMLLALARRCRERGGELRLCGVPEPIVRLLERLNVDDPPADFADRADALATTWA